MRSDSTQVSEIVGEHAARWSKARRFDAAWELIRRVRPSATLPVTTLPLERAAEAYELLDSGGATVAHLSYSAAPPQQRSRF